MLESCESFVLEQYKYIYAHKIYYLVDLNKGSKLPESYFFLAILNGSVVSSHTDQMITDDSRSVITVQSTLELAQVPVGREITWSSVTW